MTLVTRVVAPNPGPYTGPGTNTWILGAGPVVVVIDPGPDDEKHLSAIDSKLTGAAVGVVLVTHSHPDHLPLAQRLALAHGASVRRYPELGDGDVVRVGTLNLVALHTPGHSADHLSFWLAEDRVVFTGDLVLGKGSSMVTYPEGNVAAYLRSLDRLIALEPRMLFPGHWDPVTDAMGKLREYRAHRLAREAQVLAEVERRQGTAMELTRRVYRLEVGEDLLVAAEMTTRAHLQKLVEDGQVRITSEGNEEVFEAHAQRKKDQ
ncbi:MAG TPA: MBL fold metallo-hydrolase [Candidatus Acidoferrum sp.]|jgi:glyoxylase-like metal-dependent hydrolase (beta-lactamase superfamily II)|nr:MBL fold metallo-hydrolase [Candidatus Acidoferrum sp.]